MKKIFFCLSVFCFATIAYCQPMPDSIKAKYQAAKTEEEKGRLMFANLVRPTSADSIAIIKAVELYTWFKKQNDDVGTDYTGLYLALVFTFKGDYSAGLNLAFPILSSFEKRKDNYGIMQTDRAIGLAFSLSRNHEQAFTYLKKAISLAQIIDAKVFLPITYNDIGVAYSIASIPDSGLLYAQKAVNIDMENKDVERLPVSLSTVAENYMAAGDFEIAIPFLRKSMSYYITKKENLNNFGMAYVNNDFAQAFLAIKQYDSANHYAHLSILISRALGFKDQSLRSYEYLYKSFEEMNKQDSVNKYFRLAMTAKDSLYSMEKTRNMEAMSFREEIRQQEMETEKIKAEEQRKQNIQYALIAFGIITFIIFFLLFSRSIVANERFISFFGVLGLLIVFEFINLLFHPWLASVTHESPVLMLLALVLIASLLIPLHHRLETWIKEKMIKKNKAIRLAAAKKTIEQLEKNI